MSNDRGPTDDLADREFTPWQFRARPDPLSDHDHGVVDGDTYDVMVDNGFFQRTSIRVRSATVNTNEIFGVPKESTEYERGKRQTEAAREWIADAVVASDTDWPLIVDSEASTGKYGRWVGDLYDPASGESLGEYLLENFDHVKPNAHD